jgi:hypothetical protein
VPTLIGEKVPLELTPRNHLPEPYQLEGGGGEICRVLVAPPIEGLGARQLVPLFTGNLTASAGRTLGGVYKKRFVSHTGLTSFYAFLTFTMKALVSGIIVLGSPMEGVSRLELSPPSLGVTQPKHQGNPT